MKWSEDAGRDTKWLDGWFGLVGYELKSISESAGGEQSERQQQKIEWWYL